jgi:RNA polymerase primary sigma factor
MKTITGPSPITHTTAFNRFSYKIPQRELFALARLDKRAREALINNHLGLVHLVAKKYWGMPYEDLVQEGCIGLLVAIERFDPERGYRFSTYANFWIRQSLSRALKKNIGQIYLPSHIYFDKIRLEKAIVHFVAEKAREPSPEDVSRVLDWTSQKTTRIQRLPTANSSEDMGDFACLDNVEDRAMNAADAERMISSAMEDLSERERRILRMYYGFDGPEKSTQEIAQDEGVSWEMVRRVRKRAEQKLKKILEEDLTSIEGDL